LDVVSQKELAMKAIKPCCQNPQGLIDVDSPFSKIIALDFYDGPTAGVLQCETCQAEYKFDMLDWNEEHDLRVMRLSLLPPGSLELCVAALVADGTSPRWPVWVPTRATATELQTIADNTIQSILAKAQPAELIIAWSGYGDRILAARRVPGQELEKAKDWFSRQDSESGRDWFVELQLTADVQKDKREAARQRFLEHARASTFRSTGPYPTRDELHERR
jgi:hypothetical protein